MIHARYAPATAPLLLQRGCAVSVIRPDSRNTAVLARVGQPAHFATVLQAKGVQDLQAIVTARTSKSRNVPTRDVRRVVPLVGQAPRHRYAPAQHASAIGASAQSWEGDDAAAPDLRGLQQHGLGLRAGVAARRS